MMSSAALILILGLASPAVSVAVPRATQSEPSRPAAAPVPQQDDRSWLIGTWELTSFQRTTGGRVTMPWGTHPAGRISYDADGNVTALLMHEQRNESSGRPSSPQVQSEFSAYFGTYTVDAARHVISHHVSGSLSADRASGEIRRTYEFTDGSLILSFTRPQDGAANVLVWKRAARQDR